MPWRIFGVLSLGVIASPLSVLAAGASTTPETLSAGFAAAPIWLSSASPMSGDDLTLFAVVNNTSPATISGAVSFLVDGTNVGTVDASLAAGTAEIISTPWEAVAGTHTLTATFLGTTAGPFTVTVAEAPPAPLVVQYFTAALNTGGSAFSEVLQAVEDARQSGAEYFAAQLAAEAAGAKPQGEVLGTKTEDPANKSAAAAAAPPSRSLFNRMGYLFFENPLLFYPLLLASLILGLWLVFKIFSRD